MNTSPATALISVSDKTGLIELAEAFHRCGIRLLSTGGSAQAIEDAGLPVTRVSDHTGFPEIMNGRVKPFTRKSTAGFWVVAMRMGR